MPAYPRTMSFHPRLGLTGSLPGPERTGKDDRAENEHITGVSFMEYSMTENREYGQIIQNVTLPQDKQRGIMHEL